MRRAPREGGPDPQQMADGLEITSSGLRAGIPAGAALRLAVEATEWGRQEESRITRVVGRADRGESSGSAWSSSQDEEGAAEAYRLLGAVWDLATTTGSPLADALDALADHLREEARIRGRLDALAAGPRASQRLLTLLPVVGPALALLVGAHPMDLYGTVPGALSLGVGAVLTVVGWQWSSSLVTAALRPRRYADVAQNEAPR